jgi:hypothetical protein
MEMLIAESNWPVRLSKHTNTTHDIIVISNCSRFLDIESLSSEIAFVYCRNVKALPCCVGFDERVS